MSRPLAVVTGASSGIGERFARTLAADHDLLLVARRGELLDALAEELASSHPGGSFSGLSADLSTDEGVRRVVDRLAETPVDLLVNNAGAGAHGPFADEAPDRVRNEAYLDCVAVAALTRAVVDGMVQRRRGGVILLGSTSGFQPVPTMAVYAAAKAFVLSLGDALHEELRGSGVTVTTVCPGGVDTGFFDASGAQFLTRGRLRPQQVVDAALDGLRRRRSVVVPGLRNRIGSLGYRFVPRRVMARGAARVVRAG